MPFDERFRGDPFRGDFPGRRDHEPWDDLEAVVRRQVIELTQRRFQPAIRHQVLRLIQQRRVLDPGGGTRDRIVTEFDVLPVNIGFDTLMARGERGELLITGQSYDGRHAPIGGWADNHYAKGYLDALGMTAEDVDCEALRGRVVKLTHPDLSPQQLADVAKVLRTRGFSAAITNITPAAPVSKPPPGPKESPSVGQFQLVRDQRAAARAATPPELAEQRALGRPARVAIIDTGISKQPRTDGWLQGVDGDQDPLDLLPLPTGDGFLDFAAGHGTFVAGIVQQVASDVKIKVYRAADSDGAASEVNVACEMIRAVVEDEFQVLNLSLECQTPDDAPPIAIQAALEIIGEWERHTGKKVLIVAAAGNYGDRRPSWPAAFRRVISVASLAPDMLPSPYSSHGPAITFSTIGEGLRSTYVQGQESPLVNPEPQTFGANAWAVWTGTSFAAPQITGALAWLYQYEGIGLRKALRRLLAAGRPIPDFGQALKILPGI